MNPSQLASRFMFKFLAGCLLAGPFSPAAVAAPNPAELSRTLENTVWAWRNADDYVSVGGQTVVKDGAWQEVRFRGNGAASAWHKGRIVWEGRWEVVGAGAIKIAVGGPVGLVVNFDPGVTSARVANERDTVCKRIGRAPYLDPVVGRWKWGRDVRRFKEDGTATGNGTWKRIGNDRYEIIWDRGVWVDTLRMKSGGNEMVGKNQKKHDVRVERVQDVR